MNICSSRRLGIRFAFAGRREACERKAIRDAVRMAKDATRNTNGQASG